VKQLREQRVWCVGKSDGHNNLTYFQPNGAPALPDNPDTLVTYAEAAEYMNRLCTDRWPPPYTIALSLNASELVCVTLMNAYREDIGGVITSGAAEWAAAIDSYTERTWRGDSGISVRILCKGKMPERAVIPPRVQVQSTGFVPLTCMRISPHQPWQDDNCGVIRDATEALAYLMTPRKAQYVTL
jgi:hypothetical protein